MMLFRLLKQMDSELFENRVVSLLPPGPLSDMIADLGIPIQSLQMAHGRPSLQALYRLLKWQREYNPHIIQSWLYHADLMGYISGRLAGIPAVVWNVRSSDMDMSRYNIFSGLTVRACAALSKNPQAVVVNSQAGLRYHEQIGYQPRRWVHIPNGIDIDHYKPDTSAAETIRIELGLSSSDLLIGYVARYDPMKGHDTFLWAANIFVEQHPQARFILCGANADWDNQELVSLVDSMGLRNWVYLLGRRTDVADLNSAFDIATSASAFGEGFSNVIAEAMACGTPCVVTDVGDSADIVADTGIVVPVKQPEKMAAAWQKLVEMEPAQRKKIGNLARQRIVANYSLLRMVAQYEELYQSLLPGNDILEN